MPSLYIIGGCNGAGKTTTAIPLLHELGCEEYVNADKIAAGLSPLNSEKVAIEAGRLMLNRLNMLRDAGEDFAFETTLSSKSLATFVRNCKNKNYKVHLIYFWLRRVEIAIDRVAQRVAGGGHNIPSDVIKRRYERGRRNFYDLFLPLSDVWWAYDNTSNLPTLIAKGQVSREETVVFDAEVWSTITIA